MTACISGHFDTRVHAFDQQEMYVCDWTTLMHTCNFYIILKWNVSFGKCTYFINRFKTMSTPRCVYTYVFINHINSTRIVGMFLMLKNTAKLYGS